jgi:hypothetical protein
MMKTLLAAAMLIVSVSALAEDKPAKPFADLTPQQRAKLRVRDDAPEEVKRLATWTKEHRAELVKAQESRMKSNAADLELRRRGRVVPKHPSGRVGGAMLPDRPTYGGAIRGSPIEYIYGSEDDRRKYISDGERRAADDRELMLSLKTEPVVLPLADENADIDVGWIGLMHDARVFQMIDDQNAILTLINLHPLKYDRAERQYVTKEFSAKYPHAHLKPGDVLFTAAAHGPKWIGLKVDIYEEPPPNQKPPVLCCGEIMVCRLRKDAEIDPYYLLLFLRSPAGYEAIQRCIRGQSGHVYPDDVRRIVVPKPDENTAEELAAAIAALKRALGHRRKAAKDEVDTMEMSAKLFPSDLKKPIIAV